MERESSVTSQSAARSSAGPSMPPMFRQRASRALRSPADVIRMRIRALGESILIITEDALQQGFVLDRTRRQRAAAAAKAAAVAEASAARGGSGAPSSTKVSLTREGRTVVQSKKLRQSQSPPNSEPRERQKTPVRRGNEGSPAKAGSTSPSSSVNRTRTPRTATHRVTNSVAATLLGPSSTSLSPSRRSSTPTTQHSSVSSRRRRRQQAADAAGGSPETRATASAAVAGTAPSSSPFSVATNSSGGTKKSSQKKKKRKGGEPSAARAEASAPEASATASAAAAPRRASIGASTPAQAKRGSKKAPTSPTVSRKPALFNQPTASSRAHEVRKRIAVPKPDSAVYEVSASSYQGEPEGGSLRTHHRGRANPQQAPHNANRSRSELEEDGEASSGRGDQVTVPLSSPSSQHSPGTEATPTVSDVTPLQIPIALATLTAPQSAALEHDMRYAQPLLQHSQASFSLTQSLEEAAPLYDRSVEAVASRVPHWAQLKKLEQEQQARLTREAHRVHEAARASVGELSHSDHNAASAELTISHASGDDERATREGEEEKEETGENVADGVPVMTLSGERAKKDLGAGCVLHVRAMNEAELAALQEQQECDIREQASLPGPAMEERYYEVLYIHYPSHLGTGDVVEAHEEGILEEEEDEEEGEAKETSRTNTATTDEDAATRTVGHDASMEDQTHQSTAEAANGVVDAAQSPTEEPQPQPQPSSQIEPSPPAAAPAPAPRSACYIRAMYTSREQRAYLRGGMVGQPTTSIAALLNGTVTSAVTPTSVSSPWQPHPPCQSGGGAFGAKNYITASYSSPLAASTDDGSRSDSATNYPPGLYAVGEGTSAATNVMEMTARRFPRYTRLHFVPPQGEDEENRDGVQSSSSGLKMAAAATASSPSSTQAPADLCGAGGERTSTSSPGAGGAAAARPLPPLSHTHVSSVKATGVATASSSSAGNGTHTDSVPPPAGHAATSDDVEGGSGGAGERSTTSPASPTRLSTSSTSASTVTRRIQNIRSWEHARRVSIADHVRRRRSSLAGALQQPAFYYTTASSTPSSAVPTSTPAPLVPPAPATPVSKPAKEGTADSTSAAHPLPGANPASSAPSSSSSEKKKEATATGKSSETAAEKVPPRVDHTNDAREEMPKEETSPAAPPTVRASPLSHSRAAARTPNGEKSLDGNAVTASEGDGGNDGKAAVARAKTPVRPPSNLAQLRKSQRLSQSHPSLVGSGSASSSSSPAPPQHMELGRRSSDASRSTPSPSASVSSASVPFPNRNSRRLSDGTPPLPEHHNGNLVEVLDTSELDDKALGTPAQQSDSKGKQQHGTPAARGKKAVMAPAGRGRGGKGGQRVSSGHIAQATTAELVPTCPDPPAVAQPGASAPREADPTVVEIVVEDNEGDAYEDEEEEDIETLRLREARELELILQQEREEEEARLRQAVEEEARLFAEEDERLRQLEAQQQNAGVRLPGQSLEVVIASAYRPISWVGLNAARGQGGMNGVQHQAHPSSQQWHSGEGDGDGNGEADQHQEGDAASAMDVLSQVTATSPATASPAGGGGEKGGARQAEFLTMPLVPRRSGMMRPIADAAPIRLSVHDTVC